MESCEVSVGQSGEWVPHSEDLMECKLAAGREAGRWPALTWPEHPTPCNDGGGHVIRCLLNADWSQWPGKDPRDASVPRQGRDKGQSLTVSLAAEY